MTTPDRTSQQIITNWVIDLSQLVSTRDADVDNEDQLKLYARMLFKEDLPSGAFCPDSLHAVVQEFAWWPDYASLRKVLREWWSIHAPFTAPRLAWDGDENAPLSAMDQAHLDRFYRRMAENPAQQAHLESILRTYSPAAWARYRPKTQEAHQPTDAERDYVHALVASLNTGPGHNK